MVRAKYRSLSYPEKSRDPRSWKMWPCLWICVWQSLVKPKCWLIMCVYRSVICLSAFCLHLSVCGLCLKFDCLSKVGVSTGRLFVCLSVFVCCSLFVCLFVVCSPLSAVFLSVCLCFLSPSTIFQSTLCSSVYLWSFWCVCLRSFYLSVFGPSLYLQSVICLPEVCWSVCLVFFVCLPACDLCSVHLPV